MFKKHVHAPSNSADMVWTMEQLHDPSNSSASFASLTGSESLLAKQTPDNNTVSACGF